MKHVKFAVLLAGFCALCSPAQAQDKTTSVNVTLEKRIVYLEDYIRQLEPTINEFSEKLLDNIDVRMKAATDKIIVLDPLSKKFQKIETNAGSFLISVQDKKKIDNGYRLSVQVGNPNSVAYSGVTINLRWGKKWEDSRGRLSYDQWRQTLAGAKFEYAGDVPKGEWTEILVDVAPVEPGTFEYIECEMNVASVKMIQR